MLERFSVIDSSCNSSASRGEKGQDFSRLQRRPQLLWPEPEARRGPVCDRFAVCKGKARLQPPPGASEGEVTGHALVSGLGLRAGK